VVFSLIEYVGDMNIVLQVSVLSLVATEVVREAQRRHNASPTVPLSSASFSYSVLLYFVI
jgi:hypothetical protein